MRIDPQIVHHQITNLIVAYPELADDGDSWSMALASETELDEMLTRLIVMIGDSQTLIDGTMIRMDELEARRDRFRRRIEAYRSLMFKLMDAADVRKRELPLATVSVRAGTPKVIVTDDTQLPDSVCKIIRKPDLTKIKEFLSVYGPITGAEMSNGEPSLAIRTK